MNLLNYARWLTKFHDNLQRADYTHPGIIEEFEKDSFSMKRTEKPFSRQTIDLALEQTINLDADRRLTGISLIPYLLGSVEKKATVSDLLLHLMSTKE